MFLQSGIFINKLGELRIDNLCAMRAHVFWHKILTQNDHYFVAPLTWNGYVISSHTLLGMRLPIHAGIKFNPY